MMGLGVSGVLGMGLGLLLEIGLLGGFPFRELLC